jgi:transposase
MANPRLSMRNIREILRLSWECRLSQMQIHQSTGVARSTIGEYVGRAKAAGLSWPLPEELDDEAMEHLLFPSVSKPLSNYTEPDCNYIHQELRRKGQTIMGLWQEYKQDNPKGYQYSAFCTFYRRWKLTIDLVMRQKHRAGQKVFSDFAGGTLWITNKKTGEVRQAHIFVAALGASSYTYAEAFMSEDTQAWCMGHVHAFNYFGGAPEVIVPDNPKTTIAKPCRYEAEVNPQFIHMARHYGCAVIPARVRHPRDKAKVESAVNVVTKWILAKLDKRTFFSLYELNQAIWELLADVNNRPFQKLPGSRLSMFESLEKSALKQLPETSYEFTDICYTRVNIDYHIEYDGHYYSVPFNLVQKRVELRVTPATIEVLLSGKRVASHMRSFVKGKATTLIEHMPRSHREYLEWTPSRIISWANETGPNTAGLVEAIMNSKVYPEQAYRSCLGIIRFSKTYGNDRLEAACQRALTMGALSYTSVKSILATGLDRCKISSQPQQLKIVHTNIRGPQYYIQGEEENADSPNSGSFAQPEIVRHDECAGNATGNA